MSRKVAVSRKEAEEEAEDEAACEEEGKSRKRKVRIDCSDASFYDLLQACRGLLGMNADSVLVSGREVAWQSRFQGFKWQCFIHT